MIHQYASPGYAMEELRAELASYFLANRLGISHDSSQHASYIGSWIEALSKDHNEIHRASKDAEKIVEFVLQFQLEKTQAKEQIQEQPSPATLSQQAQPSRQRSKEVELEC
jgi:antirestriction protein ArdC